MDSSDGHEHAGMEQQDVSVDNLRCVFPLFPLALRWQRRRSAYTCGPPGLTARRQDGYHVVNLDWWKEKKKQQRVCVFNCAASGRSGRTTWRMS